MKTCNVGIDWNWYPELLNNFSHIRSRARVTARELMKMILFVDSGNFWNVACRLSLSATARMKSKMAERSIRFAVCLQPKFPIWSLFRLGLSASYLDQFEMAERSIFKEWSRLQQPRSAPLRPPRHPPGPHLNPLPIFFSQLPITSGDRPVQVLEHWQCIKKMVRNTKQATATHYTFLALSNYVRRH